MLFVHACMCNVRSGVYICFVSNEIVYVLCSCKVCVVGAGVCVLWNVYQIEVCVFVVRL